MTILNVNFVRAFAGGTAILARLEVDFAPTSIHALFGPSGAGKTTVLRCIAGLDSPQNGTIQFAGGEWFRTTPPLCFTPQQRRVAFVTRDDTLFPHLTVAQNVAFGMPRDGLSVPDLTATLAKRFGFSELLARRPRELSAGQKQRVAIARAVASKPSLLLLDEPLASLDRAAREELVYEMRNLLASSSVPAILVTHDRDEALALADTVSIMANGRVLQTGVIQEVFGAPADSTVAAIVGVETVQRGSVIESDAGITIVDVAGVRLRAVTPDRVPQDVYVCIRAEDVLLELGVPASTSARNRLNGRISLVQEESALVRLKIDVGFPLMCVVTRGAVREMNLQVGSEVTALIKAPSIHLVPHTCPETSIA